LGDRDVEDVEVLPPDQVEQKVERALERLEDDLERIGRDVEILRNLEHGLAAHDGERDLLLPRCLRERRVAVVVADGFVGLDSHAGSNDARRLTARVVHRSVASCGVARWWSDGARTSARQPATNTFRSPELRRMGVAKETAGMTARHFG